MTAVKKLCAPKSSYLLRGTALLTILATGALAQTAAQACATVEDAGQATCAPIHANPGAITTEHAELAVGPADGFAILVNGEIIEADEKLTSELRATDAKIADADVAISVGTLLAEPELELELTRHNPDRTLKSQDTVTLKSRANYSPFITKGEVLVLDKTGPKARILNVLPFPPNRELYYTLPQEKNLAIVYRVYDADRHYDETAEIPLSRGTDSNRVETASRQRAGIEVRGAKVTVSGNAIGTEGNVRALGTSVDLAPSGRFSLEQIFPPGGHKIDVTMNTNETILTFSRDITIPLYDAFYIAMTDMTIGRRKIDDQSSSYIRGRLAFYTQIKTANGLKFTISADTKDHKIKNLLSELDAKDPTSLLKRIDPDDVYPVYGDSSTISEEAPTQGALFARIENDNRFFAWGNSRAEIKNTEYFRNERTLYGANGHWETKAQTSHNQPILQVSGYAARPSNLPQRDVVRGTGGSIYYLSRQDITRGSEVVTIEVRDPTTRRVIDRQSLTPGTDYEINYLQGRVQLTEQLQPSVKSGVVVGSPEGDAEINLVVQYEYTPASLSVDGIAAGGRVEASLTENFRVGVSGHRDDTGLADQSAYGGDWRYSLGKNSFVEAEFARSDGPGHGARSSIDGGFIYDTIGPVTGSGTAKRMKAEADLKDIGLQTSGVVTGYHERRTAGFTSLNYTAVTDEVLSGFDASITSTQRLTWRGYWDELKAAGGRHVSESGVELSYAVNEKSRLVVGAENVRHRNTFENGERTDAAVSYARHVSDDFNWSLFGQVSAKHIGLPPNNRIGVGVNRSFANGWAISGEVSEGTLGRGARLQVSRERSEKDDLYFGYKLQPDDLRRHTSYGTMIDSRTEIVFGGRWKVGERSSIFAENTRDVSDDQGGATGTYGFDLTTSQGVTFSLSVDRGRVRDQLGGNLKRRGVSLSAKYQDDQLTASGRLEFRKERGSSSKQPTSRNAEAFLLAANATYHFDEARTLLAYVDYANINADESLSRTGNLTDVVVGYAIRPFDNDRLNLLFKYRYYYDMHGQILDGTDLRGPRQKSHILSADAEYDLNGKMSIGGKIGLRIAETAAQDSNHFHMNDASLVIANARYSVAFNWDLLVELRSLHLRQSDTTNNGALAAAYRNISESLKLGVGYNFASISDDLTNITSDERGAFLNLVAAF